MEPAPPLGNGVWGEMVLLAARERVVLTGEEYHQDTLRAHAPIPGRGPRPVTLELQFAPIAHGAHAGRRGVEALLYGQRVGELTYRMAERYGQVLEQVWRSGQRAGCRGRVIVGRRGLLEIELRLPEVGSAHRPHHPPLPGPAGGRSRAGRLGIGGTPLWVAAGVAALLVIIGANVGTGSPAVRPSGSTAGAGSAAPVAAGAPLPATVTPQQTPAPPDPAAGSATLPPAGPGAGAGSGATAGPNAAARPRSRNTTTPPAVLPPAATRRSDPAPTSAPTRTRTTSASSSGCDPNYGGCVPIASDVDCEGGGGNGPKFVRGPIAVTGDDIYGLDRDSDGTACEADTAQATSTTTKPPPTTATAEEEDDGCDPNYSGCVPIADDVNCPQVDGPVRVIGSDIYGLDRDKNGIGCE